MIDSLSSGILSVHILAGSIALMSGLAGIISRKGGRRHTTAGKIYVISMGIVVVTAVPLAVAIDSWFLLAIAVFSGYLVFAGMRVISRHRSGTEKPELIDAIGHGAMILGGSGMASGGLWYSIFKPFALAPILIVFGGVGVGLAVREVHALRKPLPDQPPWLNRHIGFMGGAYIATVTAAITVNLSVFPPLVRWLTPTLIGVPCIIIATRKYESRFQSQ